MASERFSYQKGDIQIKKTQCDFCKHSLNDGGNTTCVKFPDGKPDEIIKTLKKCPYIEI